MAKPPGRRAAIVSGLMAASAGAALASARRFYRASLPVARRPREPERAARAGRGGARRPRRAARAGRVTARRRRRPGLLPRPGPAVAARARAPLRPRAAGGAARPARPRHRPPGAHPRPGARGRSRGWPPAGRRPRLRRRVLRGRQRLPALAPLHPAVRAAAAEGLVRSSPGRWATPCWRPRPWRCCWGATGRPRSCAATLRAALPPERYADARARHRRGARPAPTAGSSTAPARRPGGRSSPTTPPSRSRCPCPWYVCDLAWQGGRVAGFSLPGTPGVLIGRSQDARVGPRRRRGRHAGPLHRRRRRGAAHDAPGVDPRARAAAAARRGGAHDAPGADRLGAAGGRDGRAGPGLDGARARPRRRPACAACCWRRTAAALEAAAASLGGAALELVWADAEGAVGSRLVGGPLPRRGQGSGLVPGDGADPAGRLAGHGAAGRGARPPRGAGRPAGGRRGGAERPRAGRLVPAAAHPRAARRGRPAVGRRLPRRAGRRALAAGPAAAGAAARRRAGRSSARAPRGRC